MSNESDELDQMAGRRILQSLLGMKRTVQEYFKDMLEKYVRKTAVIVPSLDLLDPVFHCCQCLILPELYHRRPVEEDTFWKTFFDLSFEAQVISLHVATEICYNLEMEWHTHENNRDSIVSPRELCRTLSRYMMYLLLMRISLVPTTASEGYHHDHLRGWKSFTNAKVTRNVRGEACRSLWESDVFGSHKIVNQAKGMHKDERWDVLKLMCSRVLCDAASKGKRNEHLRWLGQGGEFLTLIWFFLPQVTRVRIQGRP